MSDDKTKIFSAMRARTQENIARQKASEYTPTTAEIRGEVPMNFVAEPKVGPSGPSGASDVAVTVPTESEDLMRLISEADNFNGEDRTEMIDLIPRLAAAVRAGLHKVEATDDNARVARLMAMVTPLGYGMALALVKAETESETKR